MAAPTRTAAFFVPSCFLLVVLLAIAGRASAQTSCLSNLGSPIAFGMTRPHGSVVADWNSDGVLDFAIALRTGVEVFLGTGVAPLSAASFSSPAVIAVNDRPFAVVTADINNDGIPDLVTANNFGTVAVLLGNGTAGVGNGTFAGPGYFPAGSFMFDLVAADFDGDGRLDLAVSDNDCTTGGVNILMALPPLVPGQPRFAAPTHLALGCNCAQITTADFNADHHPDLAVAVNSFGTLQILMGVGDGSFSSPIIVSGLPGILEARAADLDRDGIVDLISGSSAGIQVHWGQGSGGVGNGTFAAGVVLLGGSSGSVAVGDLDGDGDLDLGFADGGTVQLMLQTSPRVFAWTSDVFLTTSFLGARLADFDRDGRADLLGCQYFTAGIVDVIPSHCTAPPPPPPPVPGSPWDPQGKAVAPSAATQANATVVTDGAGGVIIVWAEASRVRAQHMNGYGDRLWGASGIDLCDVAQTESLPVAVTDGAGGVYVAWLYDSSGTRRVRLLRVLASGVPAAGWPSCGLDVGTVAQLDANAGPRIAPDGSGGVYVSNRIATFFGSATVFHYTASGVIAAGWPSAGLTVAFGEGGAGTDKSLTSNEIVTNGLGGFVSTVGYSYFRWDPCCSQGEGTDAASVVSAGTVAGTGSFSVGSVLMNALAAGRSLATYAGGDGLHGVGMIATAAGLWNSVLGPSTSATLPRAVPDGAGGSFVVWDASGLQAADLFSTRLTSTGTPAPGWSVGPATLLSQPGNQREVQPAYDGSGGFLAAWRDERSGDADVYFNRFDGMGHARAGWPADGLALVSLPGAQRRPLVARIDAISAVVVWEDLRSGTAQLYAQHIALDQPVAALASVELLSSTPTRTTLRWQLTGLTEAARVERSERAGEWTAADAPTFTVDGLHQWVDERVVPGARLGYRLVGATSGSVIPGSEVWIDTPAELTLALKGFDPNPSIRGAAVSFTLPVAAHAALRVFDVSGRAVVSRDVGSLGAGRHRIDLGALPVGFYVLRLEQSGSVRVQRGTVLR